LAPFFSDEKHEGEGHEGGKDSGFVSSLFNHNPEIPKLDLTKAEPQKEDVFSAKTFAETGVHPYISKALLEQVPGANPTTFEFTATTPAL
jgi:hypothetical protein